MNISESLSQTKSASRKLASLADQQVNQVLLDLADLLIDKQELILVENQKDLDRMDSQDPKYDRLKLTADRIKEIADNLQELTKLESPLNKVLEARTLENGLELKRISVPFGVIAVVYEARPNVTIDVFALCFKSGNACVLKGGSDAQSSNAILVEAIQKVLKKNKINENSVYLAPSERVAVEFILRAHDSIDVVIPRGSQKLIDLVRENAKIPVIETGAGIVHTYFDESGDLEMGKQIICNAKTKRPSVCNALDCLIIHEARLSDLVELVTPLAEKEVQILADEQAYQALEGKYVNLEKASAEDFGKEFLSLKMSVKTVASLDEAIEHIGKYSSKHSEAIIASKQVIIDRFLQEVDAACVYANTSTAFTDGAQFGLGAEIGISTQKLHARGPMGLAALTSYKWVVKGEGQVRD